ncbi:hypothetical protein V5N11_009517 [Cardamine amara subsp. amara]|uniref:Reverse transcriptase zinc-binding domain-containing protein n=1 Tax=Cardamine amara subsp. amara TaxID=228776 RepID=A0ABD1B0T0_CARAN
MISLRHTAKTMMECLLGNGEKASFWFDNWCSLGILWDFIGHIGPGRLGIAIDDSVADAWGPNGWYLPSPHTRYPKFVELRRVLTYTEPPSPSVGADEFTWGLEESRKPFFSTKVTWNHLRPSEEKKPWAKVVWAKHSVPKHAFTFWIANLDRLPVRARLAVWGTGISPSCGLCNSHVESRDHLLLHCPFSEQVWSKVMSRLLSQKCLFADWGTLISWLSSRSPDVSTTLKRIAIQATIYFLWRERNNRLHNSISASSHLVFSQIDRSIKDTLLARRHLKGCSRLLSQWFTRA